MEKYYGKIPINKNVGKYNITTIEYNILFNKQKGCCAICHKHQSDLKNILVIDHDHHTGEVRGLLCIGCNTTLGAVDDNVVYFKNKIDSLNVEISIIRNKLAILNNKVFKYKSSIVYLNRKSSKHIKLTDEDARNIYHERVKKKSKRNNTNI